MVRPQVPACLRAHSSAPQVPARLSVGARALQTFLTQQPFKKHCPNEPAVICMSPLLSASLRCHIHAHHATSAGCCCFASLLPAACLQNHRFLLRLLARQGPTQLKWRACGPPVLTVCCARSLSARHTAFWALPPSWPSAPRALNSTHPPHCSNARRRHTHATFYAHTSHETDFLLTGWGLPLVLR